MHQFLTGTASAEAIGEFVKEIENYAGRVDATGRAGRVGTTCRRLQDRRNGRRRSRADRQGIILDPLSRAPGLSAPS